MAPLNWSMAVKIMDDAPQVRGNNSHYEMDQNGPFTKKLNSSVG